MSASDPTVSILIQVLPVAQPSSPPLAFTLAFPMPPSGPPSAASLASPLVPVVTSLCSSKPIKISDIKDAKPYLDHHELIQHYLQLPDYSTWCSDSLTITNASTSMQVVSGRA